MVGGSTCMRGFQPFLFGLSPQSLANFAEMRFHSLDEFLHNAMCELTVNCVLT
jgi:hypothetical protein